MIGEVASQCAECRAFLSTEDERLYEQGAPVSHGLCGTCADAAIRYADSVFPHAKGPPEGMASQRSEAA